MGFNFPNAPSIGQKYPSPAIAGAPVWQWDGSAWKTIGGQGLGGIYVSDTAPPGAPDNSLWWESDTGNLYVRYNDGDSSQWVIIFGGYGTMGFVSYNVAQNLNAASQTQARQNVYAAPFDAMGWSGMQINGSMEVSQERGTTAVSIGNGQGKYVVDGVSIASTGAHVVNYSQTGPGNGPPGYSYIFASVVATANASPAAGDFALIQMPIEGYRCIRLAWGTSSAQPITIGFWVYANRGGIYSGCIRNAAFNRSYVFSFTALTGSWSYQTVTIPGDTTGTWAKDNTVSVWLSFTLMCGATYQTSAGVWNAGNFLSVTGATNGVTATTDAFYITGVVVLPGIEAPSAARSPLIMRPYDQELLTCQRYWEQDHDIFSGQITTGTTYYKVCRYRVAKRNALTPTFSLFSCGGFPTTPNTDTNASSYFRLSMTANATNAGGFFDFTYIADARL